MGATVFFESASELATLSNVFKVAGTPTDPTSALLTVTSPTNVVSTYTWPTGPTLNHTGNGAFNKDITCNEDGEWTYLWEGTGTASDAEAGTWHVFPVDLGHLYATVSELKSRMLPAGSTSTADDFEFHHACYSASRWIEQYCERTFYRSAAATVRTFEPTDLYCLKLPEFNDIVSVASLKTDAAGDGTFETTWTTADYQLYPVNPGAAPEQRPYTKIRAIGSKTFPVAYGYGTRADRVEITGVFGWPSVPYGIKQAALILAAETFKAKDAPLGVQGFSDLGIIRIRENPGVARFANAYRRNAILVA